MQYQRRSSAPLLLLLSLSIGISACTSGIGKCRDLHTVVPKHAVFAKTHPDSPFSVEGQDDFPTQDKVYLRAEIKKFATECLDVDHLPVESRAGKRPGYRDHTIAITAIIKYTVSNTHLAADYVSRRKQHPDDFTRLFLYPNSPMPGSFRVVFQAISKNGVVLVKVEEKIDYLLEDEGSFEKEINHSLTGLSSQKLDKLAELTIVIEP